MFSKPKEVISLKIAKVLVKQAGFTKDHNKGSRMLMKTQSAMINLKENNGHKTLVNGGYVLSW